MAIATDLSEVFDTINFLGLLNRALKIRHAASAAHIANGVGFPIELTGDPVDIVESTGGPEKL